MNTQNPTQRRALLALTATLDELLKIDESMQLQTATAFLTVALKPGISMRELAAQVGLSQAATSRNVGILGKWAAPGKAGHGLVMAVEDELDRRQKIVNLTDKGQALVDALAWRMEPTTSSN